MQVYESQLGYQKHLTGNEFILWVFVVIKGAPFFGEDVFAVYGSGETSEPFDLRGVQEETVWTPAG